MEIDRLKLAEMKRADVLPDVVGLWLVFPHSDGVAGQGRIVGTVPDGKRGPWIVVQQFCVVTGEHNEGMRLCRPAVPAAHPQPGSSRGPRHRPSHRNEAPGARWTRLFWRMFVFPVGSLPGSGPGPGVVLLRRARKWGGYETGNRAEPPQPAQNRRTGANPCPRYSQPTNAAKKGKCGPCRA